MGFTALLRVAANLPASLPDRAAALPSRSTRRVVNLLCRADGHRFDLLPISVALPRAAGRARSSLRYRDRNLGEFGVFPDIFLHVGANWHDHLAICPDVFENRPNECCRVASTSKRLAHHGMSDDNLVRLRDVVEISYDLVLS